MRAVARDDAAAIAELDMELFPDNCFNERTLAREIEAGHGLVIYSEGQLASYILVRWDWELLDIIRIGVRPSFQNQGLGTRMLFNIVSNSPLDSILCVEKDNSKALKLYQRHNFKIIGQLSKSWVMRRATS